MIHISIPTIFFLFALFFSVFPDNLTKDQKEKLRETIRSLAVFNIRYAKKWTPPNSKTVLVMDCSNTAKYIYGKVFGVILPRSSYDQYELVKNSGNFQSVPLFPDRKIDGVSLQKKLKVGDLLFWINTHSDIPKNRQPPIGHVMIYLGKTRAGIMKMGGAATVGKGERTKNGGVDVYDFDPNDNIGCVKNAKRICIKYSEFVGYGKPKFK